MKELLEKSNLTLKKFSEKFEIPYNTIRQWYNEERKMPNYIKKLLLSELQKSEKQNTKQPKYVYCFIDDDHEIPLRLRRFTNKENVLDCEDEFWAKRYKEEANNPNVKIYRYTLSEEKEVKL